MSSSAQNEANAQQLRDLERPFLKVPFELLNKTFRQAQKAVEKDLGVLEKAVHEIGKKKNVPKDDACKYLDKFVQKLSGVKRKLDETNTAEDEQLQTCQLRIDHLEQFPLQPSPALPEEHHKRYRLDKNNWNKIRLNRILVDYLLRKGYYDAAIALTDATNLKNFVDVDVFLKSSKVIDGLKQENCTEALSWCTDNKSKLRKMQSDLEFKLRIQEFVELIRSDKKHDAIQYARKQLTPLVNECEDKDQQQRWMHQVRQVMALLAFGKNTTIACYREYFDVKQWQRLIDDFQHDNFVLYSLTTKPLLHLTLQAGLSALKTPYAYQDDCYNVNDPLCNPQFQELAENLPFSFHIHSKLVCRITGKIMDDRNPPMILPNGNVYSSLGIQELAGKSADKKTFVDPRSGTTFDVSQLKKAIII